MELSDLNLDPQTCARLDHALATDPEGFLATLAAVLQRETTPRLPAPADDIPDLEFIVETMA